MVELLGVVGYYGTVSMLVNTDRYPLPGGVAQDDNPVVAGLTFRFLKNTAARGFGSKDLEPPAADGQRGKTLRIEASQFWRKDERAFPGMQHPLPT